MKRLLAIAVVCLLSASAFGVNANLLNGIEWTEHDAGNAYASNVEVVSVGSEAFFRIVTVATTTTAGGTTTTAAATTTTTAAPTTTTAAATTTTTTVAATTTTTTTAAGNDYEVEYLFAADWSGASSNEAVNTGGGDFGTNGLTGAGAAQPTWVDTDGTNSAYADFGGDDNIDTRGEHLIEGTNFTIAMWFRPDGAMGSLDGLISKNSASPFAFSLREDSGLEFSINGEDLKSGHTATDGKWEHVAVVFDSAVGRELYIDGILTTNDAYKTAVNSDDVALIVGYDYQGGSRHFNGDIDNVIVDDTAWASNTIFGVYQAGTNDHVNP